MKKKTFLILAVFLCALVALGFWFFLKPAKDSGAGFPTSSFPSNPDIFPLGPGHSTGTSSSAVISSTSTAQIMPNNPISRCFSENSAENVGCFADPGSSVIDTTIGAHISAPAIAISQPSSPANPISSSSSTASTTTSPSKPTPYFQNITTAAAQNSNLTAQAFIERMQTAVTLLLFGFSDVQMRPGTQTIANGAGFTATGNTIHIGPSEISNLSSDTGMTLAFTVPSLPDGTYDVWVTNERGTSQRQDRPIRIIVSQNPLPAPIITSVFPEKPTVNDTVTLSGAHLGGTAAVLTSFGPASSFSSNDSSVTFRISDLGAVSTIRDKPSIKGKVIQVLVIVGTPQGYNKDKFSFGVQF